MAGQSVLQIVDLHKSFGSSEVLKGLGLNVIRGEILAVIGASGSGKTTLLRCINYLEKPSAGHIYVDGKLMGEKIVEGRYRYLTDRELANERAAIGFVFQSFNLFPHLTALDNIALAPRRCLGLSESQAKTRAITMLEKVGLGMKAGSYPAHLSGGQQQRVAIARALAMEPKLMLFDEATSALDPELVGEVLKVIHNLAKEGRTMILVTHEIQFARDVASRVIFMDEGKIVEDGLPSSVLGNPSHQRTRQFLRQLLDR
jgi:polar amino acid transport system ATP-binding protein